MNNKDIKKSYLYRGITAFLVIAAAIIFYFLLFKLGLIFKYIGKVVSVLNPLIFGVVIAYLVNPIVNFLNGRLIPFFKKRIKKESTALKTSNAISVTLSLIVFCIIIAGIVWLVVPQFIETVSNLVTVLPGQLDSYAEKAQNFLLNNKRFNAVFTAALDYGKNWLETDLANSVNKLASFVASGVWGAIGFVKNFVLGIVFAVYLLLSRRMFLNQIRKLLYAVFSEKTVNKIFRWTKEGHKVFSGFINGKLIDSLIIGILCFIGVTLIGTPYTVLVSVVIGVTNVIPVFGPWIGGIPMCLLIMLTNPIKGLYFGLFVILLQTLDGNIIGPKILGDKIGLNTFWVVFAIVVGGGLFGVIGMLIGVPCFALIYAVIVALINNALRRKGKSTSSDAYANTNGDINVIGGSTDEKKETS